MAAASLREGHIISFTPPSGRGAKSGPRPGVVITPNADIRDDGVVVVVAVSTRIGSAPAERTVSLPWHRSRNQSRTGLTQPCEAVCDWLETVRVADVVEVGGVVPAAKLFEIRRKVLQLSQRTDPPDEGTGEDPAPAS